MRFMVPGRNVLKFSFSVHGLGGLEALDEALDPTSKDCSFVRKGRLRSDGYPEEGLPACRAD